MINLLTVQKDGEANAKTINAPSFIGGMKQIRFKYDNKTYFYEYDNSEEMAREISERYTDEDDTCVFKLSEDKSKILEFEAIKDEELSDKEYSDWYVLFNGFITVAEYNKVSA